MSDLTGDIIITAGNGLEGQAGQAIVQAPHGSNGLNARCDWDSVCRPNSTAGAPGTNGAVGQPGANGGNGANCPEAHIRIEQLIGTLIVTAVAGDGGNGGNGGDGQQGGNGGDGGKSSECPAAVPCAGSAGANGGNGGNGGKGGTGGNGGIGCYSVILYHGSSIEAITPTPKGGERRQRGRPWCGRKIRITWRNKRQQW